MLKKFAAFFAALFVMLISCAAPLMRSYAYSDFTTVNSFLSSVGISNPSEWTTGKKYVYFTFTSYDDWNNRDRVNAVFFSISDSVYNTGSYYINNSNNNMVFRCPNTSSTQICTCGTDNSSNMFSRYFYAIQFDFNNNTFTAVNADGSNAYLDGSNSVYSGTFSNFDTNIPEFIPQQLSVSVSFTPEFYGNVDRTIHNNDGTTSLRSNVIMRVQNNSSFPIQYDMRILKKNVVSQRQYDLEVDENGSLNSYDTTSFDDDPVFIYYSADWVYTTNHDSASTMFDTSDFQKENKGTCWHYLAANSTQTVSFDYNQINLVEGEEYICICRAIRNDYGYASELFVQLASDDPAYSELMQVQYDDLEVVYNSEFVMINYSDVKYDYNNTNNGVLPYNGQNGIYDKQVYTYGRNARENADGSIDYQGKNVYTDKNSWYNNQLDTSIYTNNNNVNYNGAEYSKLIAVFVPCMNFINATYSLYPANYQLLFTVGFSAVVLICILKAVTKS